MIYTAFHSGGFYGSIWVQEMQCCWDGVNLCVVTAGMGIVDSGNTSAVKIEFSSVMCFVTETDFPFPFAVSPISVVVLYLSGQCYCLKITFFECEGFCVAV